MKKILRTHDELYLREDRYEAVKESFKFEGNLIADKRKVILEQRVEAVESEEYQRINISDWGCAAGEFIYYLKKIFPKDRIVGFDILPQLIAKANANVNDVDFHIASILDRSSASENEFDISIANGILTIFDDFIPVLKNLLHWTEPGGAIFIDGLFNDYPCDVNVKYNLSENYNSGFLESGWNIFSKKTIADFLSKHELVSNFIFHDFKIQIDLPKKDDPIRSWTEKNQDGSRFITNGLCLIQPQSILQIDLKDEQSY